MSAPKHVLHLVCSVLALSTAIKTALKVALYDCFDGPLAPFNHQFMEKVNDYNRTKQINFSIGPSVKCHRFNFQQKKVGVNFFRKVEHKIYPNSFLNIPLVRSRV